MYIHGHSWISIKIYDIHHKRLQMSNKTPCALFVMHVHGYLGVSMNIDDVHRKMSASVCEYPWTFTDIHGY